MYLQNLVRRLFALTGVLLFLGSFVSPFMSYSSIPMLRTLPSERLCGHEVELWSFMMRDIRVCLDNGFSRSVYEERWLFDYWFQALKNGFTWTLITLFMVQIITLIVAITSILTNRRFISLVPAILCPINTLLMIIIFVRLDQTLLILPSYKLGYWLTYPSEALFTANILALIISKESATKPIKTKT